MKADAQKKAVFLRQQGKSIKEIARILEVSTGSVSRWCKQVVLSPLQQALLEKRSRDAARAALAPWVKKNKALKLYDIKEQRARGIKDVAHMQRRDLFMLGLGLYWGEGYKRGSQEWGFTNSDPLLINTIIAWLGTCYGITHDRLRARVTINKQYENQARRITSRWSKETGIPLKQFSSPSIITSYGKIGRDTQTYRGTLRIKVSRGTSLRRRILASIAASATQISSNSRKTASKRAMVRRASVSERSNAEPW